jgi:hypothetical protein
MTTTYYELNEHVKFHNRTGARMPAPNITLPDGTLLSVQASAQHYCSPRDDNGPYTHFECRANQQVPELMPYAIDADDPQTIYFQVPAHIVLAVLNC